MRKNWTHEGEPEMEEADRVLRGGWSREGGRFCRCGGRRGARRFHSEKDKRNFSF